MLIFVSVSDEIDYLLQCADKNNDGRIDFNEFSERFHGPAQDIGMNLLSCDSTLVCFHMKMLSPMLSPIWPAIFFVIAVLLDTRI